MFGNSPAHTRQPPIYFNKELNNPYEERNTISWKFLHAKFLLVAEHKKILGKLNKVDKPSLKKLEKDAQTILQENYDWDGL